MNGTTGKRAILAIESSCDETCVAVVCEDGTIRSETFVSQIEVHRAFGGVVPEVASRAHFEHLDALVAKTLSDLGNESATLHAVAATRGPGLIGPLLVGSSYAEGLARGWHVPFLGVHHLRGHLASVLLSEEGPQSLREKAAGVFPALVLLVSGGHTQILCVDAELRAQKIADTADDAVGECFDKSAKLMKLPYPGGPEIETRARALSAQDLPRAQALLDTLPRPKSAQGFSFSGLKTAVRLKLEKEPELAASPALCWALQECIGETLLRGLDAAYERVLAAHKNTLKNVVVCGGVAANRRLATLLAQWSAKKQLGLRVPPLKHCTDNAAMIGAAAWVQAPNLALQEVSARLPLEPAS